MSPRRFGGPRKGVAGTQNAAQVETSGLAWLDAEDRGVLEVGVMDLSVYNGSPVSRLVRPLPHKDFWWDSSPASSFESYNRQSLLSPSYFHYNPSQASSTNHFVVSRLLP